MGGGYAKPHLPRQGQGLQDAEDEREPLVMPLQENSGYRTACDERHQPERLRKMKIRTHPKGGTQGERKTQLEREEKHGLTQRQHGERYC